MDLLYYFASVAAGTAFWTVYEAVRSALFAPPSYAGFGIWGIGFLLPLSAFASILAAIPFTIGFVFYRLFEIRNLAFFLAAGALCGRAVVLPFDNKPFWHAESVWLAGIVGGATYWAMARSRKKGHE